MDTCAHHNTIINSCHLIANIPCGIIIFEGGSVFIVHENLLVLVEFWIEFIGGVGVCDDTAAFSQDVVHTDLLEDFILDAKLKELLIL